MLGAILLLAVVLTQLIENAAVAIILAPLGLSSGEGIGVDPKPFMVGLAILFRRRSARHLRTKAHPGHGSGPVRVQTLPASRRRDGHPDVVGGNPRHAASLAVLMGPTQALHDRLPDFFQRTPQNPLLFLADDLPGRLESEAVVVSRLIWQSTISGVSHPGKEDRHIQEDQVEDSRV